MVINMDSKKTGALICTLRKRKGYTQSALAEILNVSNRTVSKWETGDGYPDITLLPDIANALDISVDELLNGEVNPKGEADIKVTEIENKDNLDNLFKISFVISIFFAVFGALLGTVTELYSIWAFSILFYTHWEIIFVAVSLFSIIAGGLVFAVGVTRLGVSYDKSEIIKKAGKKGVALCAVSALFPVSFIVRVIDASRLSFTAPYAAAVIVIALIIALKKIYDKVK